MKVSGKPPVKKWDLILAAIVLLAAALLYVSNQYAHRSPASYAEISVDGQTVARLNLDQDTEYTVSGYGGGYNHVVVQNGEVWVDEATCPDKICIHQGHISGDGQMIICLPNRVIVEVTDA